MSNEDYIKNQIRNIQSELQDDPNNHALLNDLGVGYYLIGEYDKAKSSLKAAVEQEPTKTTYLYNLANAYSELEEYSMAKVFYMNAIENTPDHIPSLTNLADCCEVSGEIERAEGLFEYITKLAPENALAYFNLGNFQLRQNNHISAVKNYEKALDLEDSFVDAYYNISWVLNEVKVFKEALYYAEKGLDLDSNHSDLKEILRKIRKNIR